MLYLGKELMCDILLPFFFFFGGLLKFIGIQSLIFYPMNIHSGAFQPVRCSHNGLAAPINAL